MKTIIKIVFPIFLSIILISCSSGRYTSRESEEERRINREERTEEETDVRTNENLRVLESVKGVASYYADEFNGRKTASGEIYNMYDLTAAHGNYPFGTIIRVTNLSNNLSVILKINDRQPGYKGRIIDLSLKAAEELDMLQSGLANVKIEVLKWGEN